MTEAIDDHFLSRIAATRPGREVELPSSLTGQRALELFDSQLGSRHLDLMARELGARGEGFYSIGSSGHEGNAAVAAALRPTDPALLHYRSGGFYVERARQVPEQNPLLDVLLGITSAVDEPIAGGRHKVFGNKALSILPQTSTIASHLPRAVGLAFGIERAVKLGVEGEWPSDSVVVCSFGDASANHSTAVGAINTALYCGYQGLRMPLLLVCEDNGIGISVRTPTGWIASTYGQRPGLKYFDADGTDLAQTLDTARRAADWVRTRRSPAFLRLRTVRLMGHAGSDVESAYRRAAEIVADHDRDPVLRTAQLLISAGVLTSEQAIERYQDKRDEVRALAADAVGRRRLGSAREVMAPLAPSNPDAVAASAASLAGPADQGGLTLAQSVNRALGDVLDAEPGAVVLGEDVAAKGGVYGVTRGLAKRFGTARVFDSPLDEQSVLGTGLGMALTGFVPIVEIQYLAYLHNAADQLRGEASTLRFFSQGQYRNPMVVRIAGLAYQKGFGGHFHNDNAVAALRDIPGLVVAAPGRPDDAAAMLRTCVAAARTDGRVCVFLEPIALYHTRDLHESEDEQWLAPYPSSEGHVPLGVGRTHGDGADLTLVSFANGLRMSLRVAARLAARGIGVRVLDLRWLAPLPVEDIVREATATGRVLVVDETRATGGVAEPVLAALVDAGFTGAMARVNSADSFIPLGSAANEVLLSEHDIEKAALALLQP
ncbi:thiamine pyrophosphate-dependent enzyme [Pseudonocardia spinosispora]|uniref:thiamine pyrophosphate-dependent enzyme n=1 Tax=Pseudonocardia spinosispora TaxID=103441 RepID=UPI0003FECFE1|nr:thiamine pyrophosphate-dependent enzyme [Pseudonocardia spinosispora]